MGIKVYICNKNEPMKHVLFVCHGNICRSVMAEMVLRDMLDRAGRSDVSVDSCATSREEIGNDIYPPAKRCLQAHGVPFTRHAARQITRSDYERSDLIVAMDRNNLRNLRYVLGETMAADAARETPKIVQMMALCGEDREVADPWYTGDFEATYRDVVEGCKAIMKLTEE